MADCIATDKVAPVWTKASFPRGGAAIPAATFAGVKAMVENFEGLYEKGCYKEDFKVLTSQIKEQESLRRLKRRWLMDLPLSKREQKQVEELLPPNDKIMPESLLREDDVHYEDLRICIERGYGAHSCEMEHSGGIGDAQIFISLDNLKDIFFLLDDMTNTGLYSLVEILTGGLITFEKTNWCMKRKIKEILPTVLSNKNDISKTKLKQIFHVLKDPRIFRSIQVAYSTSADVYRAAGVKLLDGLEDFPFGTLSAMHRKLKGIKGYLPTMQPPKSGWSRAGLISLLRKKCMKMLVDLGKVDEPAESLAGALGVAGLTLKLILNKPALIDFRKFSPEVEALQNDIAKAIWLLNDTKRVSLIELRKVHLLLCPNTELSVRSLRMAVRNLLTEYLFECGDMDKVPDCLLETLDIINGRSQLPCRRKHSSSAIHSSKELMKEEIQNEVEYLLIVSAQAKEVVLHILSKHEFDRDFANAYVEDSEKSDTLCISDDDEQVGDSPQYCGFYSHDLYGQTESFGETSPVAASETDIYSLLLSPDRKLNVMLNSKHVTEMDSDKVRGFVHSPTCEESKFLDHQCMDMKQQQHRSGCTGELGLTYSDPLKVTIKQNLSSPFHSPERNSSQREIQSGETANCSATIPKFEFSDSPVEHKILFSQQSRNINQYLEVQEACDTMSVVAYRLVGHLLYEFAEFEGLELYQGDKLYLRSNASVPDNSEGYLSTVCQGCKKTWPFPRVSTKTQ